MTRRALPLWGVLFPNLNSSIMRKTSDKLKLGDVLQDAWPVLPKTVKVMINKERLRNRLRPEKTGEI